MPALIRRLTKRAARSLLGVELEQFGTSLVLVNPRHRRDAWFSYRAMLRSLLEELGVTQVIDVGANTGQFATSLRQLYQGPIHSFEPVSTTYATLEHEARNDPQWHVHQVALGAERGEQTIHISPASDFSSMLRANEYCEQRFGSEARATVTEIVQVRRLDAMLEELMPALSRERIFLKMDTQGFDLEVFRGAGGALRHIVALQTEISLIPLYDGMPHWTQSMAAFEQAGFGVAGLFPINRDGYCVIEYDCLMVRHADPPLPRLR